jgi:hypothetical protein
MHSQPRPAIHKPDLEILARQGMRLPSAVLNHLRSAGIYCQPTVSIEHQHQSRKYVLRGVESGGAVVPLGAYSSFVDEHGNPLAWLQRVDSIQANGVHAVVVSPVLIRLEMVRIERTYDLLITRHSFMEPPNGARPRLESSVLFYGRRGNLEMELWGKDSGFCGAVSPVFYTRAGENTESPTRFQRAVAQLTAAACCIGCHHCHLLRPAPITAKQSDSQSGENLVAQSDRGATIYDHRSV